MAFLKDEEKKVLLDRYLDFEWPDDVADLRCVRCQRVVINHHVSNCHHLYCNNCRRVFSDGGRWKCPKCQEYVIQLDEQDFDVEIKMHKLRIFCPNKKYGCKFEDQLRNIPKHLMTCVDTREAALPVLYTGTNRIEAVDKQLTKLSAAIGELSSKLSEQTKKFDDVSSQLVGLKERMNSMEKKSEDRNIELELASGKHTEEFRTMKSILESINQRVEQNELHHQQTMEQMSLNIAEMKYKMDSMTQEMETPQLKAAVQLTILNDAIGELRERTKEANNRVEEKVKELETKTDNFEMKLNQLEKTVEIQAIVENKINGIDLASKNQTEELQSMKAQLDSINQRVPNIESLQQQTSSNLDEMKTKMTQEIEALHNKKSEELYNRKAETYEWTITHMKKNMVKDDWTFESDVFTFIGYDYDIKAKLEKTEGTIEIRLQFRIGDTVNKNLNKIGFTKCKYIIRDQSNTQNKKDIVRASDLSFYGCCVNPNWIFGYGLESFVFSPPYLNNDCMKITISLEPPSIDRSIVSNNGVLMWTVDKYRTRKKEQFYHAIWSPTFYSSPQGYRVKTRLLINNKGPMSLVVHFLTGKHDASLTREFPHIITVNLFNQTNPSKNLVKSEKHNNVILYVVQLEGSDSVEQNGFIKDNSLLLKIVIEPV